MYLKKIYILFLLIIGISLLGCVSNIEPRIEGNGLSATMPVTRIPDTEKVTAIPSVLPSPIYVDGQALTPVPSPKSLNEISCGNLKEGVEEKSYWVDDFIPGVSTIDEFLQVIEEFPYNKKPNQIGDSAYAHSDEEGNYILIFQANVLSTKLDPRWHLGEIISYYGDPVQVTWELLVHPDTLATDSTILYFPQSNAIFSAEGQITDFNADTEFHGYIYTPAYYEEVFAEDGSKVSDNREFIQHFPWPCD